MQYVDRFIGPIWKSLETNQSFLTNIFELGSAGLLRTLDLVPTDGVHLLFPVELQFHPLDCVVLDVLRLPLETGPQVPQRLQLGGEDGALGREEADPILTFHQPGLLLYFHLQ